MGFKTYNPAGNRQTKTINGYKTYYVRDAQGNILATYEGSTIDNLKWKEQHLYGSSRLGIWKPDLTLFNVTGTTESTNAWKKAGLKQYELTNHLGNVMLTISDKRTLSNGQYLPDVTTLQDYYPGGMPQPGRSYTQTATKSYRFGFNGKENDNEVKGNGNQQDYGMRIYDTRLSRFLSVDPIANEYPELTPYQFASNSPIENIDLDGLEKLSVHPDQKSIYGSDYTGFIQNADDDLRQSEPGRAFILDITADVGNFLGLGKFDDALVAFNDPNVSKAEKFIAAIEAGSAIPGRSVKPRLNNSVNGNSKLSTKAQHLYEIFKVKTPKQVVKPGVSGGKISKVDKSYRATKQVNEWNKDAGPGTYDSRIVKKIPAGKGARQKILDAELKNANKNRSTLDPDKHKTP